eukprot:TRINITY_DN13877_c0_g1_i1.p3 TRINITY_DN13877_c0_g1~~TRINITY_DN13877_c0_g1_i1.p3  ORF type:complete len:102 (-),score=4.37 TRINITY_DN13877_c0_g1_i1:284-589(-)
MQNLNKKINKQWKRGVLTLVVCGDRSPMRIYEQKKQETGSSGEFLLPLQRRRENCKGAKLKRGLQLKVQQNKLQYYITLSGNILKSSLLQLILLGLIFEGI